MGFVTETKEFFDLQFQCSTDQEDNGLQDFLFNVTLFGRKMRVVNFAGWGSERLMVIY